MTSTTKRGKFHSAITAYQSKRKREVLKYSQYYSCDPLAVAIAIDPSVVLESVRAYCTVELQGEYTRGQMVVDWRSHLNKAPNVELVLKLDIDKVKQLYVSMVA